MSHFNFDNYNLDDLTQLQDRLNSNIKHFKGELAKLEEELKVVVEKIKTLTTDATSTVQDKVEEVVETVKEEVKKAAPKRTTKKAAAKAEEKAEDSDK